MNIRIIILAMCLLPALIACTPGNTRDANLAKSSDINVELGIIYMRDGSYEASMDKLQKALGQSPSNPAVHDALGLLYSRLDQMDMAEKHFKQAIQLGPDNPSYQVNYGAYLCNRGDIAEAEQYFLKAAGNPLYRRREYAFINAGNCLHTQDPVKAEQYYRKALQVNPKFSHALYHMARISFDQKQYLRVRAYLQRYAEIAAHTPATLWLGVQAELLLGDKNAAANHALHLKVNFPDADETGLLLKMEADERQNRH